MENKIFILECPDGLRIGHVNDISDCFDRNEDFANAFLKSYFGNSVVYITMEQALDSAKELYLDLKSKGIPSNGIDVINLNRDFPR